MERLGPSQRARKNAEKVTAEAQELVRICEYVEGSRVEKPNPQILIDFKDSLAEIAKNRRKYVVPLRDFVEFHRIYEIYIRVLASNEEPISPGVLFEATNLISEKETTHLNMQSALWQLIDRGPIVWTDKRNLTLSPEVREQFK